MATNTTPVGAYRGAGRPEATAAIERAVDLFAAEIGMDPAEVRRINSCPPFDEPWTSKGGAVYDSGDYAGALQARCSRPPATTSLRADQAARRDAAMSGSSGIGLSVYVEITGGGAEAGGAERERHRRDPS